MLIAEVHRSTPTVIVVGELFMAGCGRDSGRRRTEVSQNHHGIRCIFTGTQFNFN